MAKYSKGPGQYFMALLLLVIGVAVGVSGKGNTRAIMASVVCILVAIAIVAYYRYITLPSFNKLYDDAFSKNADGKLCIKDDHAYTELRDTYINQRRGGSSSFFGGMLGGAFGSALR